MMESKCTLGALWTRLSLIVLVVCAPLAAFAEDAKDDAKTKLPRTVLLVLAPQAPVLIEVELRIDEGNGKSIPMAKGYRQMARDEFKKLDKDKSGGLSEEELAAASWGARSSRTQQQSTLSRIVKFFGQGNPEDDNAKPKSRPELKFSAFEARKRKKSPVVRLTSKNNPLAFRDSIWQWTDTSEDRIIDNEEWFALEKLIPRLDVNGDGVLQFIETAAMDNPFSLNQSQANGTPYVGALCFWIELGAPMPSAVLGALANRYSSDDAFQQIASHPSWSEISRKFDIDKSGKLDSDEWEQLLADTDNLPIIAICSTNLLGAKQQYPGRPVKKSAKTPITATVVDAALGSVNQQANRVQIEAAGAHIVLAIPPIQFDPLNNATPSFEGSVDKAKGYMERDEANRIYPLNVIFDDADENSDGMLYLKELKDFVARIRRESGRMADIAVSHPQITLFSLLDADADMRLTKAEFSPPRLAKMAGELDKSGDGNLERSELPAKFEIFFKQRPPNLASQFTFATAAQQPPPPPARGPNWFQLLDRNVDGVVDRGEYPGRTVEFKKLDANGDEHISVEEAKAAAKTSKAAVKTSKAAAETLEAPAETSEAKPKVKAKQKQETK